MIRYYYTKLKLFFVTWRAVRNERKGRKLRAKISALQTVISAGFTDEKSFEQFNKRLIENRKRALDPNREKELEQLRNRHFNEWKPKKRFKDSKDRHAQQEARQKEEGYVRVIKNRPLVKNPQDSRPDFVPTQEQKGQTNG
jgi:hypothetical protein